MTRLEKYEIFKQFFLIAKKKFEQINTNYKDLIENLSTIINRETEKKQE